MLTLGSNSDEEQTTAETVEEEDDDGNVVRIENNEAEEVIEDPPTIETGGDGIEVEVTNSEEITMTNASTGKKIRIKKILVNKLALKNVYKVGKEKFIERNLTVVRQRKQEREERERDALHTKLYEFQMNMANTFDNMKERLESMKLNREIAERHRILEDIQKMQL